MNVKSLSDCRVGAVDTVTAAVVDGVATTDVAGVAIAEVDVAVEIDFQSWIPASCWSG